MTIQQLFNSLEGNDAGKVKDWLVARKYVLEKCPYLDGPKGIGPDSDKHVHVNILMDEDGCEENMRLTMAIARQVALLTHYPNFKENEEETRTVISILYRDGMDSARLSELLIESMGNLPLYCQFLVDGKDESMYYNSYKDFMPLDIAIEIRRDGTDSSLCPKEDRKAIRTDIRMADVQSEDCCREDSDKMRQSMQINMAYCTGADIDNLPAYDNANVKRYTTALHYFFNHSSDEMVQKNWNKAGTKEKLSCLFCADCINEHLDGLLDTTSKPITQYIKEDKKAVIQTIEENIEALALCEHSRWNVEKLILGFRPYTIQERFAIETLFGDDKRAYKNKQKSKGIHIDLCSYRNLRRIDPNCIKYDYFMMLAMPHIISPNDKCWLYYDDE